jgi:hypothetical protein
MERNICVLICILDYLDFCNPERTRLKQSEDQPFQRCKEQRMERFSMKVTVGSGSDIDANQHNAGLETVVDAACVNRP